MDLLDQHLALTGHATTSASLALLGISRHGIATAVASGRLVPVRRGAYVSPPTEDPFGVELHRRTCAAAVRSLRGGVVASHLSAAVLLGLPVVRLPERPEVTRLGGGGRRGAAALIVHRPPTRPCPVTSAAAPYGDVTCVSAAVAAVQVAARYGGSAGMVVAEAAARAGLRRPELEDALVTVAPVHGATAARDVAHLADVWSESPAESVTRWALHCLGVAARQQVPVRDSEGFVGWVDFLIEGRVVLEIDGRGKYTDPAVLWEEKRREDRLRRRGLVVVRATWRDVTDPARLSRLLREAGVAVR